MIYVPQRIQEKIQKAKDQQLKELDLNFQGLSEIPAEVFELEWLVSKQ